MVDDSTQLESIVLNSDGHPPSHLLYDYIGLDDHWMEPLLHPGSLILLDPSKKHVQNSGWRDEFERPMYFVDVRSGYRFCWCSFGRNSLVLQPNALSQCAPEERRYPDEAEIVGELVGVAMRLSSV